MTTATATVLGWPAKGMPKDLIDKGWDLYRSESTPHRFRARNNRLNGIEIGPYPNIEELVTEARAQTDEAEEQAAIQGESATETAERPFVDEYDSTVPDDMVANGWYLKFDTDPANKLPYTAKNDRLALETKTHRYAPDALASARELEAEQIAAAETNALIEEAKESPGLARTESLTSEKKVTVTRLLAPESVNPEVALQMRVEGLNMLVVADYKEAMLRGEKFPPGDVFHNPDTGEMHLGGGAHRRAAAAEAGLEFLANVHEGTKRDAVLFAAGENETHGTRRTNADKRRAVLSLLKDEEWAGWSDALIAEMSHASPPYVGDLRRVAIALTAAYKSGRDFTDADIAQQAGVTPGLVSAVRTEWSSQNVLSEHTTRVGRDRVARDTTNIGRKTEEEQEASKQAEREVAPGLFASEPELEEIAESASPAPAPFEEDSEEDIAAQTARREVAGGWSTDDVVSTIRKHGGTMYRGQLEEAGCTYAAILSALHEEAIEQPEVGVYRLPTTLPEAAAPTEDAAAGESAETSETGETAGNEDSHAGSSPTSSSSAKPKPKIDEILKGRMLTVSFAYIPKVAGVSVSVRAGKPEEAERIVIASTEVPPFPQKVIDAITRQLKGQKAPAQTAAPKSSPRKPARRPAASRSKTAKVVMKKKAPAKKSAKKKPAPKRKAATKRKR